MVTSDSNSSKNMYICKKKLLLFTEVRCSYNGYEALSLFFFYLYIG